MKVGQVVYGVFKRDTTHHPWRYIGHFLTKAMADAEAEEMREDGNSVRVDAVTVRIL